MSASVSYARRAKAVLIRAGLAPKKSWGQNFLMDDDVLCAIVAAAQLDAGGRALELGAGLGALTLALLERGIDVWAIERDRDLVPLLQALAAHLPKDAGTLTVEAQDAARIDYRAFAERLGGPLHVLGNLPYQLSGRILVSLAEAGVAVQHAVVLVQREVGQRLCAEPGSKAYGLLTVLAKSRFDCEVVRDVPPGAFLPPPRVQSQVVRLTARAKAPWDEMQPGNAEPQAIALAYRQVAKAAFHTRRKTLQNALGLGLSLNRGDVQRLLQKAHIDGQQRAEVLRPEDFAKLAITALELALLAAP